MEVWNKRTSSSLVWNLEKQSLGSAYRLCFSLRYLRFHCPKLDPRGWVRLPVVARGALLSSALNKYAAVPVLEPAAR